MRLSLILASVFVVASPARASMLYSYVGDTFLFTQGVYEPNQDRITGSFVLSDAFPPPSPGENMGTVLVDIMAGVLGYTFTDGHQTLTEANSTAEFRVGFNLDGTPLAPGSVSGLTGWWIIHISAPAGGMSATFLNGGEFESAAWIGAPQPSGFHVCSNGLLCYDDPSIDTARINNQFRSDEIGGTPGTWTLARVPEPSTWSLLSVGAVLVLSRRFRAPGRPA